MARRAALMALTWALISCGSDSSNSPWSCTWHCNIDNSGGTATYPGGANPTQQCTTDHQDGCTDFSCSCNQS